MHDRGAQFQRDLGQYEKKNAVIIGVSVDTAIRTSSSAQRRMNFKLLADTTHRVSTLYDSLTTYKDMTIAARHTFLINRREDREVYLDVKPNEHSARSGGVDRNCRRLNCRSKNRVGRATSQDRPRAVFGRSRTAQGKLNMDSLNALRKLLEQVPDRLRAIRREG